MTDNVDYKIRVIKNNSDFVMVDGESVLENVIEGHVDHAGYYTIPVEEDVVLEKGEEYLVCITFSSDTEPCIFVLVDGSDIDVEGGISFVNNMENDRSYYGIETPLSPSGVYLANLIEDNGVTARIKAFTSNVIVGDVNFDEKINALDVIEMRKDLKFDISGEVDVAADINDDGKNNALDFIAMKKYIGNKYEIIK